MLFPTVFDDFDELLGLRDLDRRFRNTEKKLYGHRYRNEMKTDIKETENGYEVLVDLPGFKKEDIKLSLENGYLTLSAEKKVENNQKDGEKFIRQERCYGSMSRSFYVGDSLKEEDVKANFNDGVLKLELPKPTETKQIENKKYIAID